MLDTVARPEGDKFFALIANINGEDLGKLAEKLRFMVEMNGLHQHACERLRTTISIGGVVVQSGESAAELLRRADDLLRAAKTAGLNRLRC
jgi:diguanylate cyclase (GGDEF)-like protein